MTLDQRERQPVANAGVSRRKFLGLTLAGGAMVTTATGIAARSMAQDAPPATGPQYALIIDTTKCVGCGLCVEACRARNDLPEGQSYTRIEERKDGERTWFLPVQCQHCAAPPCATVCPTLATYIHPSGVVLINEMLCVGCKYCIVACPYQARIFDEERGVADKCSLCLDRVLQGELPACVQACLPGARVFGRTDDPESEASKLLATGRARPLHWEFGTQPALLTYIIEG